MQRVLTPKRRAQYVAVETLLVFAYFRRFVLDNGGLHVDVDVRASTRHVVARAALIGSEAERLKRAL